MLLNPGGERQRLSRLGPEAKDADCLQESKPRSPCPWHDQRLPQEADAGLCPWHQADPQPPAAQWSEGRQGAAAPHPPQQRDHRAAAPALQDHNEQ